jgi:hypothetical protein
MSNKNTYICLLLILIVATTLRFFHIGKFGIFNDEKQGIMVAVGNVNMGGKKALMAPDKTFTPQDFWRPKTIAELFDANARGDTSGNATVHLISMNIFGKLFGHSDASLRSVSAVFNILTILWIFFIGKNLLKSNRIALLGAFLASIEPFFIVFSQQARFYTTSIFFSTLASYYFLKIVLSTKTDLKTYIAYTLSIIFTIFSNYLAFTIFLCHGIFWLVADRRWVVFKNLVVCYVVMAIPFVLWMTKGPGQYALIYIKHATTLYKDILNNPSLAASYKGFIDLASWENLFKRGISIICDYFVFTNGAYDTFGNKIVPIVLVIFVGIVAWVLYRKSTLIEQKILLFSGLVISVPFLFSLVSAYNAGVMTGFYFRYTSFGLPFVSVLMAWFVIKSFQFHKSLFVVLSLILLIQSYSFAKILKHFYEDAPQKYTASHDRGPNPYIMIAEKIKQNYAQGDTVVYPSVYETGFTKAIKRPAGDFDNHDAQLVNLYLPKNATFVQKINLNEANKVILKKKNKTSVLLFDLEGSKYRY